MHKLQCVRLFRITPRCITSLIKKFRYRLEIRIYYSVVGYFEPPPILACKISFMKITFICKKLSVLARNLQILQNLTQHVNLFKLQIINLFKKIQ